MEYVLGIPTKANKKADKGNVVHKVLECLAHKELLIKAGKKVFEDEGLGKMKVSEMVPRILLDKSYDYYVSISPQHDWMEEDRDDCWGWVQKALVDNNGEFNPANIDIVSPEIHFDLEIPYDWAKYDFVLNDEHITGNLHIKGTIDLVRRVDENTYEIVDYKTGQRKDWNKGKIKDFNALMHDRQLQLYYYAARRLFPDIKDLLVNIYFIRDGGAYQLPFDDATIGEFEKYMKETFISMKSTLIPQKTVSFKCKWCPFFKPYVDRDGNENGKNICNHIHSEVLKKGIRRVTEQYTREGFNAGVYADGGGQKERGT
jgi:CRISPR/Cas system-associated exonuclease Cas4 (RecB family)